MKMTPRLLILVFLGRRISINGFIIRHAPLSIASKERRNPLLAKTKGLKIEIKQSSKKSSTRRSGNGSNKRKNKDELNDMVRGA